MPNYLVVAYERVKAIDIYDTLEEATAMSKLLMDCAVQIYPVGDDMAQSMRQAIAEREAAKSSLDSPDAPPETI